MGFCRTFGDAVVRDLDYLTDNGIPISMFSLQNEPKFTYKKTYSVYARTPISSTTTHFGLSRPRSELPIRTS